MTLCHRSASLLFCGADLLLHSYERAGRLPIDIGAIHCLGVGSREEEVTCVGCTKVGTDNNRTSHWNAVEVAKDAVVAHILVGDRGVAIGLENLETSGQDVGESHIFNFDICLVCQNDGHRHCGTLLKGKLLIFSGFYAIVAHSNGESAFRSRLTS